MKGRQASFIKDAAVPPKLFSTCSSPLYVCSFLLSSSRLSLHRTFLHMPPKISKQRKRSGHTNNNNQRGLRKRVGMRESKRNCRERKKETSAYSAMARSEKRGPSSPKEFLSHLLSLSFRKTEIDSKIAAHDSYVQLSTKQPTRSKCRSLKS